jgi:hypothetical protein
MLRGLAKANTWVAKPGGSESLLFLPLDTLGGLAQSQPKVIRPKDTISNECEASFHCEHAWSERSPDPSSMHPLACRPRVSLHAELWRSVSQPLCE